MILEAATLNIKLGTEAEFEQQFELAQLVISQAPGYIGHQLHQGLETPGKYLLLVRWQTLADHTEGFRGSPAFVEWRRLLGPYFNTPPAVEHLVLKYEL